MKRLKTNWLVWSSKVLMSALSMLGLSSCWFQPCMYGVPRDPVEEDSTATDSTATDSTATDSVRGEFKGMYGVRPVKFQHTIEKDGVEMEIDQK